MLTEGSTLPPHRSSVSDRLSMVRMALLVRDPNQLHLDADYARLNGFADVVQQGPIHASQAMVALCGWAGAGWRIARLQLRFLNPVLPGAVLTTHGQVAASEQDRIEIDFEQFNCDGGCTLRGRAWMAPAGGDTE
jgi:acyl dehydratase